MKRVVSEFWITLIGVISLLLMIGLLISKPTDVYAEEKNGLYHEGDLWNYYVDGSVASDVTTLVKYNGYWWYVREGKIDFSATTVIKYNGTWWYIRNGKVDFSARTLCKYNGVWWFVENGKIDWNATTVVRYGNDWYFVRNGQVDWTSETLCKYNNEWWYVKEGRIRFGATTLCRYNGTWWYVQNGKVNFNSGECLVPYNGEIWYVKDGRMTTAGQWGYGDQQKVLRCGDRWYIIKTGMKYVKFHRHVKKEDDINTRINKYGINGIVICNGYYFAAVNSEIYFSLGHLPAPENRFDEEYYAIEFNPNWEYYDEYWALVERMKKKSNEVFAPYKKALDE